MPDATPVFTDDMTLGEARALLRQYVDDGYKCPCCTQMAKVYRRTLSATMARALITLYKYGGAGVGFVHAPSLPGDTHEISQLQWWELVQEERVRRPDDGRAGYWRCTPKGQGWLAGRLTVPKYARVYDGRCLSLVGDQISLRDALGKRFRYDELMEDVKFPDWYGQDTVFGPAADSTVQTDLS